MSTSHSSGSSYTNYWKGTYTSSAPTFTLTTTHEWYSNAWHTDSGTTTVTLSGSTLTYNGDAYTKQ